MKSIAFGGDRFERLEIRVINYERPAGSDHYDDNWLSVEVHICCGAFRGKFSAAFLTFELRAFHDQLAALYQTLSGSATFRTLEEQLALDVVADSTGHLRMSGEAWDQPGIGNQLSFSIELNQTQLQAAIQSLRDAIAAFPLRTEADGT